MEQTTRKRLGIWLGLAITFGCWSCISYACSIPVFRYALDRWQADFYRIETPTDAAKEASLAPLLRNLGHNSPVNLQMVAPANPNGTQSQLLFPQGETPVWSGYLEAEKFSELTDSPIRTELAKRLLSGDSGVWIVLESGQKELDDAEVARLEKRIAFLETVADLPSIDPNDPSNRLGPGPELRVGFSLIRISKDDRRENVLRTMLLGPLWNPVQTGDGPIAAVVFGRGRVLGAWPTKELDEESIDEACLFLLGACSCQVKQLNPGWDLMMSLDWDQKLLEIATAEWAEEIEKTPDELEVVTETVTIRPRTAMDTGEPDKHDGSVRTRFAFAGAGLLIVLGVFLSIYSRRVVS